MGNIHTLDPHLANQIAAGEVVERPISVVKELLENSIDAGATQIKVEIELGGTQSIMVTDNGHGMNQDDLILAPQKYTTSKISTIQDLHEVMSLGFRGEALAAICSVADVTLTSNTGDAAYQIQIQDGVSSDIQTSASGKGTRIQVQDLFAHVPARLNYLKKPTTEYSHILQYVQSMSLLYPDIAFECIHNGKTSFKVSGHHDLPARIHEVYGTQFSAYLLPITCEVHGMKLTGYISDPKVSFSNKQRQLLGVNGRIIHSPMIHRAILNAYNRFIPHGSFPAYVLRLELDPTQVDVNVHPRKQEVRFATESSIFRAFFHSVEDALNTVSLEITSTPSATDLSGKHQASSGEAPKQYYTGSGTKFKSYSPYTDLSPHPAQAAMEFSKQLLQSPSPNYSAQEPSATSNDLHDTPLGRIVGQIHRSYIIVETAAGFQVLDQHALAERVIYEKLVHTHNDHSMQGMLISHSVDLTAKERDILEQNSQTFAQMGFEYEIISGNSVLIQAIPDFLKNQDISEIFLGILADIGDENFSGSSTLQEVKNKIFAYTACRAAIKFGHRLNLFEMNKLLHESAIEYSATCPHGRPVVYEINLDELKDKYER